jgi:hypothetical protein
MLVQAKRLVGLYHSQSRQQSNRHSITSEPAGGPQACHPRVALSATLGKAVVQQLAKVVQVGGPGAQRDL